MAIPATETATVAGAASGKPSGAVEGDQSLRAQLEEVIDEHEDGPARPAGDLSRWNARCSATCSISANDADDVAIPRGEIIAIPCRRQLGRDDRDAC
jgi:hypothetical protein